MKKLMFLLFVLSATVINGYAENEWQVNRIVHDENYVYVGTENVGLIAIDKKSGSQTQYLHKWNDYARGITDVSLHGGKLYYVTKYYKLITLKDGEMTDEPINVPYAAPDRFLFPRLAWAPDGALWTFHIANLIVQMGRITFFGTEEPEPEYGGLFPCEEVISAIAVDKDGDIWFSCKGVCGAFGIGRFSKETGMSIPILKTSNHNIYGSAFSSIIFDSNGNRWFASNNGMVCFDKSETLTLYELRGTKSDICQLPDGRFLVSNEKDLYSFGDGEFCPICENASNKTIRCLDADVDAYYYGTEDGLFKYEAGQVSQIPLLSQTVGVEQPEESAAKETESSSCDLQGRRVADGELHKGVYIQGGKKIVVK